MTEEIIIENGGEIVEYIPQEIVDQAMAAAGAKFDDFARGNVFESWRTETARNTLRRKAAACEKYAEYIDFIGEKTGNAAIRQEAMRIRAFGEALRDINQPLDGSVWCSLTFGLVEGFQQWLLKQGYAIGSVNNRISTLRSFAELAFQAGCLPHEVYLLISSVKGIGFKKGKRIDENRNEQGVQTRVGAKKAKSVEFSINEAVGLIEMLNGDTGQGRRDRVILALLLEHGLRVSEVADIRTDDVNVAEGWFKFYRPKTANYERHKFRKISGQALRAYFTAGDAMPGQKLLRGSRRGGGLTTPGVSTGAINKRVRDLGKLINLEKLSPHDFRHHYAGDMADNGTDVGAGKRGGGWASVAMYERYINAKEFGNEGVKLSTDKMRVNLS